MAVIIAAVVVGVLCEFFKLQIVRQAGGLKGWWTLFGSTAEVRRIRKGLGNDPRGKRMDLFGQLGTLAWITAMASICIWQIHTFRSN
jgi:hypothetical protein